ncbi:DUF4439 domain-containing protein [Arthrobacter cheniae]|uniref:DUF4439 domain-containing protein n=1 Tax=Arthrobacter cheniae TaxID=1258888 RepID=A0A3A5MC91_9MICC|nr:DUF4439 domain-containing protein [Arthrobacter cheniae]RJT80784.1 DUF4439 domain-containing protein [Arthrobacter cheniae]
MTGGQAGRTQGRGARPASVAARAGRAFLRLVGLFIVVLLVVGIGLNLRSPEPEEPVFSASQRAQLDAERRYRALADEARTVAAAGPASASHLTQIAEDLDAHADAVALPRSPRSATQGPTVATPPPASEAAAVAPSDEARVLTGLHSSALLSLRDAMGAEAGPRRVLAAAGANQWRHTALLAQALEVESGLLPADALSATDLAAGTGLFAGLSDPSAAPTGSPVEPAAETPTPPTSSLSPAEAGVDEEPDEEPADRAASETPAADCSGTPIGPDADRQALLTAKTAEDQARYGYDVAAAVLPEPAKGLARSAIHRAAADAAARRLAELCMPVDPAPAGFALGPEFRADPVSTLRELEEDHAELYAGLVATTGPDVRAWAITAYNAAAQRSLEAGTPLAAFPGLDGTAGGTTSTSPGNSPSEDAPQPRETEQGDG